jgi:HEAT repeat protein
VVKALADLPREERQRLAAAWPELPEVVRRRCARLMHKLAEERIELNFDRALDVALDDASAEIRRTAVAALWENESSGHLARLTDLATGDPDATVRIEAVRALGRFAGLASRGELAQENADELRELLTRLAQEDRAGVEVRAAALASIGAFGGPAVGQLIVDGFQSDETARRRAAMIAMGRSMEGGWLDPLVGELVEGDDDERRLAAAAIGEIGDPRAVAELAATAIDPVPAVRQAAIAALGQIGGATAAKALGQLEAATEAEQEMIHAALAEAQGDSLPF